MLNLLQELRTKRGSGLVMHTIFGGGGIQYLEAETDKIIVHFNKRYNVSLKLQIQSTLDISNTDISDKDRNIWSN